MRPGSLIIVLLALAGCPGGDGAIGDPCISRHDCSSELQCLNNTCVPRCQRAPECGDGYRCDEDGVCQLATGEQGDTCTSEVDCVAGLSCQISGSDVVDGYLLASCVAENAGRPAGAQCDQDGQCRNGTCDLGHCIDLCHNDRDCGAGTLCSEIPRVAANGMLYRGCLQSRGAMSWTIPVEGPSDDVLLPIPSRARSVSVLFKIEDQTQLVGATHITAPNGTSLLEPSLDYWTNINVRHRLDFGQSVLMLPVRPDLPGERVQLQTGAYQLTVASKRLGSGNKLLPGTATPQMTAVIKVDDGATLDLHFYFLNFEDHACAAAFNNGKLDAQTAQTEPFFHDRYLGELAAILNAGGIALGIHTYTDLPQHPDLDGLDAKNLSSLLSLGEYSTGINVFFVRSLSPVGLQALGPNPGPAGLPKTRLSGIVISIDTLCYKTWEDLARTTAHEIARYMGLYDNVEPEAILDTTHVDPLADTPTLIDPGVEANLMFFSELGGITLTNEQIAILRKSAVLR